MCHQSVYASKNLDRNYKFKEVAPPVLRLKAKREQLIDHVDEGAEAAEQSMHDKQKQKRSPRKQRSAKSRSRDSRAE